MKESINNLRSPDDTKKRNEASSERLDSAYKASSICVLSASKPLKSILKTVTIETEETLLPEYKEEIQIERLVISPFKVQESSSCKPPSLSPQAQKHLHTAKLRDFNQKVRLGNRKSSTKRKKSRDTKEDKENRKGNDQKEESANLERDTFKVINQVLVEQNIREREEEQRVEEERVEPVSNNHKFTKCQLNIKDLLNELEGEIFSK